PGYVRRYAGGSGRGCGGGRRRGFPDLSQFLLSRADRHGCHCQCRLAGQLVDRAARAWPDQGTGAGGSSGGKMKILSIGAGSMGRRRLRDLTHLAPGDIILCEKSPERAKQVAVAFGVPAYTDLDQAFAQKPEVVTVSTPPAFHEEPVRRAMDAGAHVFAEVPFVLNLETMRGIARGAAAYGKVLAASHSFRMYPPVRLIRDLVCSGAIGKPLYLEHSLGQHVAGWHTYEHYNDFYAGDIRMGGAGTDMIAHEF